jgi:hypothetical protein
MGQISLQIPQAGQFFSTEGAKVATDLTTIQTWANGNVDSSNVANSLAASAAVNTGTQTVKGAVNIATSESRTNIAYGTLTTPDQVTGIVLPSNGLIAVWYQAMWQCSVAVANTAQAAIFVGSNQLQVQDSITNGPSAQSARLGSGAANVNQALFSLPIGLASNANASATAGDITTGQAVGFGATTGGGSAGFFTGNGANSGSIAASSASGGPCWIFAAAGTYTISVQFKASSGSVTASNRKLWVQALSFA